MSAGNKIVNVRIDDETLAQIEQAIIGANELRQAEPYILSSWIREAIKQKLQHLARARKQCKRNTTSRSPTSTAVKSITPDGIEASATP